MTDVDWTKIPTGMPQQPTAANSPQTDPWIVDPLANRIGVGDFVAAAFSESSLGQRFKIGKISEIVFVEWTLKRNLISREHFVKKIQTNGIPPLRPGEMVEPAGIQDYTIFTRYWSPIFLVKMDFVQIDPWPLKMGIRAKMKLEKIQDRLLKLDPGAVANRSSVFDVIPNMNYNDSNENDRVV